MIPATLLLLTIDRCRAVTFEYTGVITEARAGFPPLPAAVRPGATFTATLSVEEAFQPLDTYPDPNIGSYPVRHDNTSAVLFSFNVAGEEYHSDAAFVEPVFVNKSRFRDQIFLGSSRAASPRTDRTIGMRFFAPAGSALTSDAWTTNYAQSTWPDILISGGLVPYTGIWSSFDGIVTRAGAFLTRTHGTAGVANLYVSRVPSLFVESRSGGSNENHTMFFIFDRNIATADAAVTSGMGAINGAPTIQDRTVTVNLTGVRDAQDLTVTLTGLTATSGEALPDASATAGFLLGDVNGDRKVNAADAQIVRSRSGETTDVVSFESFRCDVNADGRINSADAMIVRSRRGNSLSP